MRRLRRMISGRVPRIVRTFIEIRSQVLNSAGSDCVTYGSSNSRSPRSSRVTAEDEYSLVNAVLLTLSGLHSGSIGQIDVVPIAFNRAVALLLGHHDLVDLLTRPDAGEHDGDVPAIDQHRGRSTMRAAGTCGT